MKFTIEIKIISNRKNGKTCKADNLLPIQSANPLVSKPKANVNPPPNSNNIPQGSLTASCQSISLLPFSRVGKRNRITTVIIAIIVSSILGIKRCNKNERAIHAKAVTANTTNTDFSLMLHNPFFPKLLIALKFQNAPQGNLFV